MDPEKNLVANLFHPVVFNQANVPGIICHSLSICE